MKSAMPMKGTARLAAMSFSLVAILAGHAVAMPVGGGIASADDGHLLQKAAIGQHRVYPGSDSAAAEKAREGRNAPNMFCEKQETRCE